MNAPVRAERRLVIVGAGMAAVRLIERLRELGDRRPVTLVGAERALPYNRVLLSPLLAGECDWPRVRTHPAGWYAENGVELCLGARVAHVDTAARRLHTEAATTLAFDDLVIATGSRGALPGIPGITEDGVGAFRDIADLQALRASIGARAPVVVLGGSLLGVEAAAALAAHGLGVTLVHRASHLLNRHIDAGAGQALRRALAARGVRVLLGVEPVAIERGEQGLAIGLSSGARMDCARVVAATGIEPEIALARAAGLATARGILVDECLATSAPGVYALGECAEFEGECVGLLAPVRRQAEALAATLAGADAPRYRRARDMTALKVAGIDLHAMGSHASGADTRELLFEDRGRGVYRRLWLRDGALAGAVLYGDVRGSPALFELCSSGARVADDSYRLLLAGEPAAKAA